MPQVAIILNSYYKIDMYNIVQIHNNLVWE
jgi:hypothetical protein